ncbi:MAG: IS4 family transposase [Candidatus Omnitrophica bacterium]|nr:IS4 family transposase [Candidatus Omnitrophota bacterium]
MNNGKTVFSQVMDFLPLHEFRKCVMRYRGDYKVRTLSCLDQFLSMSFAQMTYRESLRDIETCLKTMSSKLYHMGIRGNIARNNLARANENRDWRIYADFAQILIHQARKLYQHEDFGIELEQTVYALDASTIDLCLSLFPWAHFRTTKGAVKLHTLLDLRGPIPAFIEITDGKVHDVNILDILTTEPGSFYVMDRGYLDFKRLYALHQTAAFFVIRAKSNMQSKRLYSHSVDKSTGLQCDQTILLTGHYTAKDYPDKLRRVRYYDSETDKRLVFLTNNFSLPALTIARLYKARWQVELFFKWIKQHLRIKAFYGTSENAVKTQIWIAISTYVLIAIIKKRLDLKISLYTFLQIISVTVFEKMPIYQALHDDPQPLSEIQNHNQLSLFDL